MIMGKDSTISTQKEKILEQKQQLQVHKGMEWSREKTYQLIALYKKHECLWNHWHKSYKNRNERKRAIQDICNTIQITKSEYSRKIDTLRNQFNSQMKKLEILQEAKGPNITLRPKWKYFESLSFLHHHIERRPEVIQPSWQKIRLKSDFNHKAENIDVSDELTSNNHNDKTDSTTDEEELSQFEYIDNVTEELITDDFQSFENDRKEVYDQKCQSSQSTLTSHNILAAGNNEKLQKSSSACSSSSFQTEISINDDEQKISNLAMEPCHMAIKTTTSSSSPPIFTPIITSITSGGYSNRSTFVVQDEWDAFGVLVANEFRNLNSELSRKILKRKIMQAMLQVGEIDDNSSSNYTSSSI